MDSSVATVMCKKVFPENILGLCALSQPSPGYKDALLITKKAIPHKTIDLNSTYDIFLEVLLKNVSKSHFIAEANLKPRLRMIALYYYANLLNYMVVGTSNKSEIITGYITKYGDGGVDIEPLGGLLKSEVYEIAEILDIPDNIIKKKPSAGLWVGQTDQQEMGLSYEELDGFLRDGTGSKYVKTRAEELIGKSEHKRNNRQYQIFK